MAPPSPHLQLPSLHRLFDTDLSAEEKVELAKFLSSDLGRKVLRTLFVNAPRATDTAGDLSFRAGVSKGWQDSIDYLSMLTEHSSESASATTSVSTSGAYPDIDDSSRWNDDGTPKL